MILALLTGSALHGSDGLEFVTARIAPQGLATQSGMIIVRCVVKNTAKSRKEGVLVAKFVGELTSEDRCRVQMEPQVSRIFEFPIRIPPGKKEGKLEIQVSMVPTDAGTAASLADQLQPETRLLTITRSMSRKNIFAAVALGTDPTAGPDWRWEETPVFHAMEFALASRVEAELTNDFLYFEDRPLPLNWSDWQGIDTLILADPRHLRDQATVSSLRAYLSRGGRLWIMLDTIDCSLVEGLLTSNQSIRHVDTMGLNRFQVDVHGIELSDEDRTAAFDHAIPFKRISQIGGEVTHSIDGWPAAMLMPVGRGELVLTMLASQAWIEPRKVRIEQAANHCNFELRPWAKSLVDIVYLQRPAPLLNLPEMDYPLKRIGNPVVSRGFVTSTLLSFCGALMALGLWFFVAGGVPRVGLWIPALALAACTPILIAGIRQKQDIPDTLSRFQWVQFSSPSGGTLRESAAVYLQAPSAMTLSGRENSFAITDPRIQSGITTVLHEDFERWRMTNTAWPAGVWRYTTDTLLTSNSIVARGVWTSRGLEIQIPPGLPAPLTDPILNFVTGSPVLGKTNDGNTILIDGEFSAEGDRWTLRSMVDDEQTRRAEIYKKYFELSDRLQAQTQTLIGWSELFPNGPAWDKPMESRGAAMVSLPVVLSDAKIGDEVLIPYSCIRIQNATSGESASLFMEGVGKWISQSSSPTATNVAFELPKEVVPLEPKSVKIHWDIEAPRRQVRLSLIHPKSSEPIELVSLDAPSLAWESVLVNPAILQAARSGKLVMRIEVSEDRVPGGMLPWRIRHLRLSVRGTVLPKYRWETLPIEDHVSQ